MPEEVEEMNDYIEGRNDVLKAVERWENEGGRVGRTYLAPDTPAVGNAAASGAPAVSRPTGSRVTKDGSEGARVFDAARDTNS
jgi:hypothetical protein